MEHTGRSAPGDDLAALLGEAFAGEVASRLPRLLDAAARLLGPAPGVAAARAVVMEVHALASSAALVGEELVAGWAREVEELLAAYADGSAPPVSDRGPALPRGVAEAVGDRVGALALGLSRWVAA